MFDFVVSLDFNSFKRLNILPIFSRAKSAPDLCLLALYLLLIPSFGFIYRGFYISIDWMGFVISVEKFLILLFLGC